MKNSKELIEQLRKNECLGIRSNKCSKCNLFVGNKADSSSCAYFSILDKLEIEECKEKENKVKKLKELKEKLKEVELPSGFIMKGLGRMTESKCYKCGIAIVLDENN